jgi:hypothetical protein
VLSCCMSIPDLVLFTFLILFSCLFSFVSCSSDGYFEAPSEIYPAEVKKLNVRFVLYCF